MLPQNKPDRIRILFDDHRLVANAGLLLPATLARHLGLRELVGHHLDLGGVPGRANTGDKMLKLVASALAGGDCIDDADALRAGGRVGVPGCVVKAPSTLGTFLRSLRWGHVRQLGRLEPHYGGAGGFGRLGTPPDVCPGNCVFARCGGQPPPGAGFLPRPRGHWPRPTRLTRRSVYLCAPCGTPRPSPSTPWSLEDSLSANSFGRWATGASSPPSFCASRSAIAFSRRFNRPLSPTAS